MPIQFYSFAFLVILIIVLKDIYIKYLSIDKKMEVEKKTDEFVSLIRCDTEFYRRFYKSKAVKKTLSIPEWLNEEAAKAGLNFSQVLQEGLKERLGLK